MKPREILRGPTRYAIRPFLKNWLESGVHHRLNFQQAKIWYNYFTSPKVNPTNQELAYLGCVDRFFLFVYLLKRIDGDNSWVYDRCREVETDPDGHLDLWARFHYKDQCKLTPVFTTTGWKCHGDLIPGDFVFSPSGHPVRVVATKHFTDSACRRVRFDTGAEIVCGAGHLWKVEVKSRRRKKGTKNGRIPHETKIVETSQLSRMRSPYRPAIKVTDQLQLPHVDLPIDPYVLGVWLGDGTSSNGAICGQDDDVFEQVARRGYTLSHNHCPRRAPFRVSTVYGLKTVLDAFGLCNNKHIPEAYLMASAPQRLELLRGLIDTDGSVSALNGCVTFAQKRLEIAEGVQLLANSLGFKARLTPVRSTGTWHVTFQVNDEDPEPCYVKRKLARLHGRHHEKIRGWKVVSVEDTETVPTNCIQVDSADGMYLCGKDLIPTHNSSIITFAGIIQEILRDPELTVSIFSHTKDIAQAFLEQIKTELENNDSLKNIYSDVLFQDPSKQSSKWSRADGIIIKRKGNPKEATVEAHGLVDGQPISRHYGLMVFDDVVTAKAVTSTEQIRKTTVAWENADNLSKAESNRKWVAGTRWSFGDTYGIMIERKDLKPRIYPATHNGKINGDPVFLSPERWAEIKATQKSTVSAQMLLNPTAGNEAMFQVEWFRGYESIPAIMNVYIMVDPSKGRTKDSDRTAIAVVGVDPSSNKYLLDGVRHRMKLSERYQFMKQFHRKWTDHPGVQMVKVGYEIYGMQADLEVIEENQQRENIYFEVTELNYPRQGAHSKNSRVERMEPDMRHGRFYIPAVVWNPDAGGAEGTCQWTVWTDRHAEASLQQGKNLNYQIGQIVYYPLRGLTKQQRYLEKTGQRSRIVTPIRRLSEDREPYDLTRAFIEEARFFPFAPHDDLVDVMSRLYDMDVQPPVAYESSSALPITEDDIGHFDEGGGVGYDA